MWLWKKCTKNQKLLQNRFRSESEVKQIYRVRVTLRGYPLEEVVTCLSAGRTNSCCPAHSEWRTDLPLARDQGEKKIHLLHNSISRQTVRQRTHMHGKELPMKKEKALALGQFGSPSESLTWCHAILIRSNICWKDAWVVVKNVLAQILTACTRVDTPS